MPLAPRDCYEVRPGRAVMVRFAPPIGVVAHTDADPKLVGQRAGGSTRRSVSGAGFFRGRWGQAQGPGIVALRQLDGVMPVLVV